MGYFSCYDVDNIIKEYRVPIDKIKWIMCDNLPRFEYEWEKDKDELQKYLKKFEFGSILENFMGITPFLYLVGKTKIVFFERNEEDFRRALIDILKDKDEYEANEEIRKEEEKKKQAIIKQLHGKRKIRCECCGGILDGVKRDDDTIRCEYCGAIQDYYVIE